MTDVIVTMDWGHYIFLKYIAPIALALVVLCYGVAWITSRRK